MPTSPKPLCATLAPDLDWSRAGTPASTRYDDIYFSVDGGLEETNAVFLQGCGLPERWQDRDIFTIGELGFGSGLNFFAAWDLWQKTAPQNARLYFNSVEAYPWTRADLHRAFSEWPHLEPYTKQLLTQWPGQVKGLHRLHFGNVTLTLFHMHAEAALSAMDAKVDAWFLDGFSPSKNPEMWSENIFQSLAEKSAPNAQIGTFTVAGHVRRGLAEAGFNVEKKPGFGRKRERLQASFPTNNHGAQNHEAKNHGAQSQDTSKTQTHPPILIGGGIASASIAKGFLRRGITPILIDPDPDLSAAASGNPAALVMPRLDLQDRPESRFFLSAYLYALTQYQTTLPPLHKGITHIAKSDDEQKRFHKLLAQQPLPSEHMRALSPSQIQDMTGLSLPCPREGLHFPNALLIDPKAIILAWTESCTRIVQTASSLTKTNGLWSVYNKNGEILAQSETVFVCAGANVLDLLPLSVRFTRGQICWGKTDITPLTPLIYGGYAAPYADGILLGATHAHVQAGQDSKTKDTDTAENIEQFSVLINKTITETTWSARASVRVTTKDTLPISSKIEDGLYVMTGLGSRGFMMAPLLGEALVCNALDEPAPLCKNTSNRFIHKQ
ncbi:MAG: hypothetical protein COA69_02590 [Robiginitomaculum sp.]|nr:MAG: hypothetical protein COA69_02590 [Robiginitomaculum sp.]